VRERSGRSVGPKEKLGAGRAHFIRGRSFGDSAPTSIFFLRLQPLEAAGQRQRKNNSNGKAIAQRLGAAMREQIPRPTVLLEMSFPPCGIFHSRGGHWSSKLLDNQRRPAQSSATSRPRCGAHRASGQQPPTPLSGSAPLQCRTPPCWRLEPDQAADAPSTSISTPSSTTLAVPGFGIAM